MKHLFTYLSFVFLFFFSFLSFGQSADSTKSNTTYAGTVGVTNNGFSIIPTFSLNKSAVIMNYFIRKKKFSFDPDIRLVFNAEKGGFIFWFRYYAIEKKKFNLRLGVHPAFTFIRRTISENGNSTEITEMLRFAAAEVVPSYQITPRWNMSAMFLHGSGLQKNGPQNTNVLFFNNSFANLKIGGNFKLDIIPTFYILYTDGSKGSYFTGTAILSNQKSPFSLQGTINQTIKSNVLGNQNFMWNVMLAYNFRKVYKRIN